jgi:hypothetical protein
MLVMPDLLAIQNIVHSIVSNEWFSRKLGKEMYCTDDADVTILGMVQKKRREMSQKMTINYTDEGENGY